MSLRDRLQFLIFVTDEGFCTSEMQGFHHILVEDLILNHEVQVATYKKYIAYKCPCSNCKGGIQKSIAIIKQHLREVSRDPFLYHSMVGEDPPQGFLPQGIWVHDANRRDSAGGTSGTARSDEPVMHPATIQFLDRKHDIQQQVFDAMHRADDIHDGSMRNIEHTRKRCATLLS